MKKEFYFFHGSGLDWDIVMIAFQLTRSILYSLKKGKLCILHLMTVCKMR